MKKILLSLGVLLSSLIMSAQPLALKPSQASFMPSRLHDGRLATVNAPRMALGTNQQYMGAYTTDTYTTEGIGLVKYPATYSVMAELPASLLTAYDGGKVVGLRFAVAEACGTSKCYIINYTSAGLDTLAVADVSNSKAGWNDITFEKPFILDVSSIHYLLMGFDYVQTSENYPLSVVNEGTSCTTLLYGDLGSGEGFYDVGISSYGNLSVQAVVEKDYLKTGVSASDFEDVYVLVGNSNNASVTLQNYGTEGVSSLDYTITRGGVTSEEKHIDVTPAITAFANTFEVDIPLEGGTEVGTDNVQITFTKVNGVENTMTNNVASGKVITVKKLYTKRVAVEEMTGTGCGWCPRGLMGMKVLRETFGDRFVGIGLHWYNSTDYMYLDTKKYASLGFSGAPSCMVNRGDIIDPYYGSNQTERGICTDFQKALDEIAPVGVEISGHYDKNFGSTVTATATLESQEDAEYKLEFVAIADSVYNETKKQSNYYYYYSSSQVPEDLAIFAYGGECGNSTFAWAFDDVAITSSYTGGVNKQSNVTLKADEPQEVTFTMSMPSTSTLTESMNFAKVAVIALVIDKSTGKIVNCAKSDYLDIEDYEGTASYCDEDGNMISSLATITAMDDNQKMCSGTYGIANFSDDEITKTVTVSASTLSSGSITFGTSENNVELTAKGEEKEITFTIPAHNKVIFDATAWTPTIAKAGSSSLHVTFDGHLLVNNFSYSKTSYPLAFCKKSGSSVSTAGFTYKSNITKQSDNKVVMENYGIKNQNSKNASTGIIKATATTLPSGKFYFTVGDTQCVLDSEGATAETSVTVQKSTYTLFTDAYWEPAPGTPNCDAVIDFTTGDKVFTATFKYTGATAISQVKATDSSDDNVYNVAGQKVSDSQKGIVIVNGKKVLK